MNAGVTAATTASTAGAAATAMGQAIKASGAIVKVKPEVFADVLSRIEWPLIIISEGGLFRTVYHYMTSYQGFIFYTKSKEQLALPAECEVFESQGIWIPS